MDKFCVFCGQRPKGKNKEHILPRWLIEHTGDLNRKVRLGMDWRDGGKPRAFSYGSFTFPACTKCNTTFGKLEVDTKPIILKLLNKAPLAANEFQTLLDWFDKVRIGLWLGFYYLDKNLAAIEPKFHVASRVGAHDRMLSICMIDGNKGELSFRGCDMPAFYYTPSCFSMIIDNIGFFNLSEPFLFSRRVGLPYPTKAYLRRDGLADYYIVPGSERVMKPIIRKPFRFKGIQIYQPMFSQGIKGGFNSFYSTDYVDKMSEDLKQGIGKVFLETLEFFGEYPKDASNVWIPSESYVRHKMNPEVSIFTLELQLFIDKMMPSYERLPKKDQKWYKDMLKSNRVFANHIIKILRENEKKMLIE